MPDEGQDTFTFKEGVDFAAMAIAAAMLLYIPLADAAPSACPQHHLGGQAPDLVNPRMTEKARELCYGAFGVLHSGVTRGPLWSAERLTGERLAAARKMRRQSEFHAEGALPREERAELSDYKGSGFDRGHMAPSGDMPDADGQQQSFSLANIVPQDPDSNQNLWERIEEAVRNRAKAQGDLYVVTGPLFAGDTVKRLKGRVFVPTHVFKAVYDPKARAAGAYLVANAPGEAWQAVSLSQLRRLSGLDVFPSLPQAVKDAGMALPPPVGERRYADRPRAAPAPAFENGGGAPAQEALRVGESVMRFLKKW